MSAVATPEVEHAHLVGIVDACVHDREVAIGLQAAFTDRKRHLRLADGYDTLDELAGPPFRGRGVDIHPGRRCPAGGIERRQDSADLPRDSRVAIQARYDDRLARAHAGEIPGKHLEIGDQPRQVCDDVQRHLSGRTADIRVPFDDRAASRRGDHVGLQTLVRLQARESIARLHDIADLTVQGQDNAGETATDFGHGIGGRLDAALHGYRLPNRAACRFFDDDSHRPRDAGLDEDPAFVGLVLPPRVTAARTGRHGDIERVRLEHRALAAQVIVLARECEAVDTTAQAA
jgi:hypothetical protein